MMHEEFKPLTKIPTLDEYDREIKRRLWARRRRMIALYLLNPLTVLIVTIIAVEALLALIGY